MRNLTIDMANVYNLAGFPKDAQGRVNLPARSIEEIDASTAKVIETIEAELGGPWRVGPESIGLLLTGACPLWLAFRLGHWVHARVKRFRYVAPNTPGEVEIFNHGC